MSNAHVKSLILGLLLFLLGVPVSADISTIQDEFQAIPLSSRPHTWWHWMSGNITKEGITADLEAMARVGVGGAQIFNVSDKGSCNIPDGPIHYMSAEWLELVHHAVKEAKRVGVEICMHNCAGWSSSGGPWITPEFAMKKISIAEMELTGGKDVNVKLPKPTTVRNYYHDIMVLAFPTPKNQTYRIDGISEKAEFSYRYGIDLDDSRAPADAVIAMDKIVDLSDKFNASGTLSWNAPEGNWTVLRIGYTLTGKDNHPASGTGLGLECDKLSRKALDLHWDKGIMPILNKLGDLAGPVMNNFLIDSYEVGINNWTQGFDKEFQSRRGYDLAPYLVTLTGRVVDTKAVSERFLWDYRRTISDLFTANYFGYFADKCHDAGLLCSTEPYDGPFECMTIAPKADILMGEFWVGGGMNQSVRIASSVAHVYGRKIVGAESFTSAPNQGRWQNHPRSMKALGDDIWCNGVNRYIFHRYAHQPWLDVVPGMTMGQWGTHFERTNTWWEDGKAWMDYIRRSQYLLQEGKFHADILFFGGEIVPNGAVYRTDIKRAGYDYDAIGTDLMGALTVKNGKLHLPSGMEYSILVLPESTTMSVGVAKKIQELVKAGATVLGPKPTRVPGLAGYPASERELQAIADDVWGKGNASSTDRLYGSGRVLAGMSVQQAMNKIQLLPDFKMINDWPANFIHRVIEGADVYFVSNQDGVAGTMDCAFRVTGKKPMLWNSQTGAAKPAGLWHVDGEQTIVTLEMEPEQSVFVVFAEPISGKADSYVAIERKGGDITAAFEGEPDTLEIVKAEYGVFSLTQGKMVDVTDVLRKQVKDNKLGVWASNQLAGDPADGVVKSILVEYSYDGKVEHLRTEENKLVTLPPGNVPAGKELKILRAVYGDLPNVTTSLPEIKTVDITRKLSKEVRNGMLSVRVTNAFAGGDPVVNMPKQVKVTYLFNGVKKELVRNENDVVNIPNDPWQPSPWPAELCDDLGKQSLLVWNEGTYHLKKARGGESIVKVDVTAKPMELSGPWAVTFESKAKTPTGRTFNDLAPLNVMDDKDVQAFSGTATYTKDFAVSRDMLAASNRVVIDLGRVEVMARVIVNDRDLGVLWKNPYRLDITDALKAGKNTLVVKVTNLWVNRIIGDEMYPEDCDWAGVSLAKWPDWFGNGMNNPLANRPSKDRTTFYTWKHWHKVDDLKPSGLIGPVYVRVGQEIPVQ